MDVRSKLPMEFNAAVEKLGKVQRHQLFAQKQPISFKTFINALTDDSEFREHFNTLLSGTPFEAFRFETPALCSTTLDDPFEFVLIDAPNLLERAVDAKPFSQYFNQTDVGSTAQAVEFKSLGGDARLIVPTPQSDPDLYNHLASFSRNAAQSQIHALWRMVGQVLIRDVGSAPLWLNTEGSGVAWLHVRIDSRPKYYGHTEYKKAKSSDSGASAI